MKRILVVDDVPAIRKSIRLTLSSRGYSVVEAGDGKQAMHIIATEPVDLLITDIFMPEKDGLETIMELRRARPELKIIAISGGGATEAELSLCAASDFGAVLTLVKPFTMVMLTEAVQSVLGEDETN